MNKNELLNTLKHVKKRKQEEKRRSTSTCFLERQLLLTCVFQTFFNNIHVRLVTRKMK